MGAELAGLERGTALGELPGPGRGAALGELPGAGRGAALGELPGAADWAGATPERVAGRAAASASFRPPPNRL
jgi:hypothetical protein